MIEADGVATVSIGATTFGVITSRITLRHEFDDVPAPRSVHATLEFRLDRFSTRRFRQAIRRANDRRRYNRARRKAVRSVLAGLAALSYPTITGDTQRLPRSLSMMKNPCDAGSGTAPIR